MDKNLQRRPSSAIPPPPPPNLQMPETLHSFEEKIQRKKDEHCKHLENLKKSVERTDASLKVQSMNRTELANECNKLHERCEDEVTAQRITQENVGHTRMVNKLLKAHFRANQAAAQEFERIVPRVSQYVDTAERLLTDAMAKEARDQLVHQQTVVELRQRLSTLAECRESYNNWMVGMDASAVGELIAKVDVMCDEIAIIKEDSSRIEHQIEFYIDDNKKKALLVQQKKDLKEKRAARAEDITKETLILTDQGERMKNQQYMLETLQETLATEQVMTKEAGAESSELQEKLLTLECTNATDCTTLLELRQRSQGMQEELEVKMQILKQKQAEEASHTKKVKELDEVKSTKFWERNAALSAWESEKECMLNVLSGLKKEKDKMNILVKEEELQRSKMQELLEKRQRDEKSWESEKARLTETLKAKDQELSEFMDKISNLKRKFEIDTANNTKMEENNHNMRLRIDAKNKEITTIEEKSKIVKQTKVNSIELELKLSEELSTRKENANILSEDKDRKDSAQTKKEESWAKEEATLVAGIVRKEKEAENRKKRMEQLENDSASVRNDNMRNSNGLDIVTVKSQIATCKDRQETDTKCLSTLMSDNQARTHTRADWDMKIETCRKETESLQRQLKALCNTKAVKEREDVPSVAERGPTEATTLNPAVPLQPTARRQFFSTDGRNVHGRSSSASSSARLQAQGDPRVRSASGQTEAWRRHCHPVQSANAQNKHESDLEYDFSDF